MIMGDAHDCAIVHKYTLKQMNFYLGLCSKSQRTSNINGKKWIHKNSWAQISAPHLIEKREKARLAS